MYKIILTIVLVLVADTLCQRIIHPTWRPPRRRPIIIRTARSANNDEPLWLYKGDDVIRAPATGDHPVLPKIIDDINLDPNRRYARSVSSDEPLWLYKGDDVIRAPATGDHSVLPKFIDDINLDPNRRHARSIDSPSARRSSGSHSSPRNHDTGRTHPGYNRRNARDLLPSFHLPNPYRPPLLRPLPGLSRPRIPIYASPKLTV